MHASETRPSPIPAKPGWRTVRLQRGSAARSLVCAESEERARTGAQRERRGGEAESEEMFPSRRANWTTEPEGCPAPPPAEAAAVESTPVSAEASRVRASSAREGRGSAAWASAKRAKGSAAAAAAEEEEEDEPEAAEATKRLRRRCWR